jgi:hypothetical protein
MGPPEGVRRPENEDDRSPPSRAGVKHGGVVLPLWCLVKHRDKFTLNYVESDVFTAVTMRNAVFWDINTQFVPHKTHCVSATEPSRLMRCKI